MAKNTRVTEDGEVVAVTENTSPITIVFKTPWNHDTTAEAQRTATVNLEETMTQQHMAGETDINNILQKYASIGIAPPAAMPPTFFEKPEVWNMQEAIELVRQGEEAFMALPAESRKYFDNDLARYSAFVDQRIAAGDVETLRKLGIDVPEPPKATTPPAPGPGAPPDPKTATDPVSVSTIGNK